MIKFFLAILVFISFSAIGQIADTAYYDNGRIHTIINFNKEGKLDGLYSEYSVLDDTTVLMQGEHQNGLYTYALKEGLNGMADKNEDGDISMSELKEFLYNRVFELSNGKQKPTARQENIEFDYSIY